MLPFLKTLLSVIHATLYVMSDATDLDNGCQDYWVFKKCHPTDITSDPGKTMQTPTSDTELLSF
jgi:hypothetical protein